MADPMTGMEILNIAALVVGVGAPVVTLIYREGRDGQRLRELEARQDQCRATREHEETCLHGRITECAREVAYLKGRQNGHDRNGGGCGS